MSATTARPLSNLAGIIQSRAAYIENALESSHAPQPSLAVGASYVLPLAADQEEFRDELVGALDELRALVLGPLGHFNNLMFPMVTGLLLIRSYVHPSPN